MHALGIGWVPYFKTMPAPDDGVAPLLVHSKRGKQSSR